MLQSGTELTPRAGTEAFNNEWYGRYGLVGDTADFGTEGRGSIPGPPREKKNRSEHKFSAEHFKHTQISFTCAVHLGHEKRSLASNHS